MNLYAQMQRALCHERPVVEVREPKPGYRHQPDTKLVYHRFPVKGGLTLREAMAWNMYQPNPLFALFEDQR